MKYNIKILKETPFDKVNTILSPEAFRVKYSYLINTHNSDKFLADYIISKYKEDNLDINLSEWFEVIEIKDKFKIGDWVWHEKNQKAYTAVVYYNSCQKEWRPNYTSVDSINSNPNIYRRLATQEEIKYFDLHSFCDGQVLIGEHKCYYFNNVWKELRGIQDNIRYYFECYKKPTDKISVNYNGSIDNTWLCVFNGLKVGCKVISHEEIMTIANILKIK